MMIGQLPACEAEESGAVKALQEEISQDRRQAEKAAEGFADHPLKGRKNVTFKKFAPAMALVVAMGMTTSAANAETVLKAVTFQPVNMLNGQYFQEFMKRITDEVPDVTVNIVGGPEAIPADEQGNAVSTGVVDVAQLSPSRYLSQFPISSYYSVTEKTPQERRANGTFDYLNEQHIKAMNARSIASTFYPMSYHIYLGDVGEKAMGGDFSGMKIRGNATYRPMFDKLGITTIPVAPPEIYTAMERGTVEGYGWVPFDVIKLGFGPVTKYRVEPAFFHAETVYLFNEDTWQSLTDEQRTAISKIAEEFESYASDAVSKIIDEEYAAQEKAGIKVLELSGDAKDRYMNLASEAGWEDVKDKTPDLYEKLREFDGL